MSATALQVGDTIAISESFHAMDGTLIPQYSGGRVEKIELTKRIIWIRFGSIVGTPLVGLPDLTDLLIPERRADGTSFRAS